MATAAFRSTTKRSSVAGVGDAGSSTRGGDAHRRSRSLSRSPSRFPPLTPEQKELPTPRSKFVNKARGSGFSEISLDDLADEFFRSKYEEEITPPDRGRNRRISEVGIEKEAEENSRRRGRSVSRKGVQSKGLVGNGKKGEGIDENGGARRRQRSLSVAHYRCSDPESNLSALTDDEVRNVHPGRSRTEKTVWTVSSQRKTKHPTGDGEGSQLYDIMHKEVRHAAEEIRTELQKVMLKAGPVIVSGNDIPSNGTDVIEAVAEIRKKYSTEIKQSEKRKQLLLAELAAEEERGQELTKIVRELLPAPPQTVSVKRPSQSRRRSNDRRRMSERLIEEAEKYFEDFLSNVEDTDISSFDGEKSDTSSSLGGSAKLRDSTMQPATGETHLDLQKAAASSVETDGVVLPWLQWETYSDSPLSKSKAIIPMATRKLLTQAQEESPASVNSSHFTSSRGSWSPECDGSSSVVSKDLRGSRFREIGSHVTSNYSSQSSKGSSFDLDDYLYIQCSEELIFERSRQRHRIDSGGLILCRRSFI